MGQVRDAEGAWQVGVERWRHVCLVVHTYVHACTHFNRIHKTRKLSQLHMYTQGTLTTAYTIRTHFLGELHKVGGH